MDVSTKGKVSYEACASDDDKTHNALVTEKWNFDNAETKNKVEKADAVFGSQKFK